MDTIKITVDMNGSRKSFKHFFNAFGYANTDYTYTGPSRRMYDYLSSYHRDFLYMRLHNILTSHGRGDYYLLNHGMDYGNKSDYGGYQNDDRVVSIDEEGNLSFDWTYVDMVYDIMQEHKIRPIVETVFLPTCLRKSEELWFIPRDFNLWKNILQEFVKHLQERYGREEVEHWYFEVWNEADCHKYWVEDPSTFLALYDYMEDAVHSINPNIKVGGPAVMQNVGSRKIFKVFLEHCARGLNYATGKFGTRVDFISVHCKGGYPESNNPSTDVMFDSIKVYMDMLKEYSEFDGIEFFNDESDIVWYGNLGIWKKSWLNFRNTHYSPGFTCKMMNMYCDIVEDQYGVNLSIVDSDNCHIQWERKLFNGNRSQLTPLVKYPSIDLLKKPVFNSYVLLNRLGTERLTTECCDEGFGRKFGVLPTVKDELISLMVWNFEDGMDDDVNPRTINLEIKNIAFTGKYNLIHYRIDEKHSNSYNIWRNAGKPITPSTEQIKMIREREGLELYEPVKSVIMCTELSFNLDMPMHSVSLLLLTPESTKKPDRPEFIKGESEQGYTRHIQVFLKWKPNTEDDFLYYKMWKKKQGEGEFTLISDNISLNTAVFIDLDVEKNRKYIYKVQAVNASMLESDYSDVIEVLVK